VQANTIVNRQGRIMLEGGSQGVVEVGGTLQASGVDAGTQGGTISATGDKVSVVSGALLDTTGQSGGGNVLIGGVGKVVTPPFNLPMPSILHQALY
jgi:hypothetical protein